MKDNIPFDPSNETFFAIKMKRKEEGRIRTSRLNIHLALHDRTASLLRKRSAWVLHRPKFAWVLRTMKMVCGVDLVLCSSSQARRSYLP